MNNEDTQFAISQVEKFAIAQLSQAFPQINFSEFVHIDTDEAGAMIGIISDEKHRAYSFAIAKGDPNPLLQRTVIKDGGSTPETKEPEQTEDIGGLERSPSQIRAESA